MLQINFWKKWSVPFWAGTLCATLLAIFFSLTLSGVVELGGVVKRYFENPLHPNSVLFQQGINTPWKLFVLIVCMTLLNSLNFYIGAKYTIWRWHVILSPPAEYEGVDSFTLLIFCTCCVVIELFMTTVAIANIFVSFTNYLMLFSVAVAHGIVIFIMGKKNKSKTFKNENVLCKNDSLISHKKITFGKTNSSSFENLFLKNVCTRKFFF